MTAEAPYPKLVGTTGADWSRFHICVWGFLGSSPIFKFSARRKGALEDRVVGLICCKDRTAAKDAIRQSCPGARF
jgi:hypothetical protein